MFSQEPLQGQSPCPDRLSFLQEDLQEGGSLVGWSKTAFSEAKKRGSLNDGQNLAGSDILTLLSLRLLSSKMIAIMIDWMT